MTLRLTSVRQFKLISLSMFHVTMRMQMDLSLNIKYFILQLQMELLRNAQVVNGRIAQRTGLRNQRYLIRRCQRAGFKLRRLQ